MIRNGDQLPEASLMRLGESGPEAVELSGLLSGRKVAIFAVPGAFTPTCTQAHLPSFIRNMDKLRDKGIGEVICITVNDPFVADAWAASAGADGAGIKVMADPDGSFTRAIGMEFTAPPVGLLDRSKRYAMLVDNGTVMILNVEASPGECDISAAENLLADL